MARLLYGVADIDFSYPETDPCEITVTLTQAELYAAGSYKLRYPAKENGRALVDMAMQLSAVALAVVTVGFAASHILDPHQMQISKTFSAAEAALLSKNPERAADILSAIKPGTPKIIDAKRLAIFNQAMIARARVNTRQGRYPQAIADLSRIPATAAEAPAARQLLEECRNLQAFHNDAKSGMRLSTTTGVNLAPASDFSKTDDAAAVPVIRTTRTAPSPQLALRPSAPVRPYRTLKADAPTLARVVPATAPQADKTEKQAPSESLLPPQLLPASTEGGSYWLQDNNGAEEPAAVAPDIETAPADKTSETSPIMRLKREWKTAPAGKTKFADN